MAYHVSICSSTKTLFLLYTLSLILTEVAGYIPDSQISPSNPDPSSEVSRSLLQIYVAKCCWESISTFTYSELMISSLQLLFLPPLTQLLQNQVLCTPSLYMAPLSIYPESRNNPSQLLVLQSIHYQASVLILNVSQIYPLFYLQCSHHHSSQHNLN